MLSMGTRLDHRRLAGHDVYGQGEGHSSRGGGSRVVAERGPLQSGSALAAVMQLDPEAVGFVVHNVMPYTAYTDGRR